MLNAPKMAKIMDLGYAYGGRMCYNLVFDS